MSQFAAQPAQPLAKQIEFDHLVKEIRESGNTLEESVVEALETLEGYDLSGLNVYRTEPELQNKIKLEANCRAIERTAVGQESVVNCNFAFQGLKQELSNDGGSSAGVGAWRMVESKRLIASLIRILRVEEEQEKEHEKNGEGDESDDAEDEEEDKILFNIAVIDTLIFLHQEGGRPNRLVRPENFFGLDEELVTILMKRIDEDIGEARVLSK